MGTARDSARRVVKDVMLGHELPRLYKSFAQKMPLNDKKALFINGKLDTVPDAFSVIMPYLSSECGLDVRFFGLNQAKTGFTAYHQRCRELMQQVADAKYIFLEDASDVISCLPLRQGTKVVQLWHACGAFKKWGMSTGELKFGSTQADIRRHPFYGNLSLVTVSAPEVEWAYREAMNLEQTPAIVKPLGVSRTDVFFDEGFVKESRDWLARCFPESQGRKVILYAPTFRGAVKQAKGPDALDIKALKAAVGNRYVLAVKHHPFVKNPPAIPAGCEDFAYLVEEEDATSKLLCAADVLVTDYSSVVFEYSLFERPMAFFAHDIDDYNDWRGFYYDYDEMTPGPVVKTTGELIGYLESLEEGFDRKLVAAFRERFMSACDGHATQRICDYVLSDDPEADGTAPVEVAPIGEADDDNDTRNKRIWLFNAGNAFAGNPKWLFLYLQEHHPEIECYWLCYRKALVKQMHAMGYSAFKYDSPEARLIGSDAGVYVVEQNKEVFQDYLQGITVLNLWHGVTVKKLEHAVLGGYMEEGLVAKHIRNESVYRKQLFLVTSPEQERVFREQCKIDEDKVVRAPYPRCFYDTGLATFDHDLLGMRGLDPHTRIAVYAPTFRDFDKNAFFARALPDPDALVDKLKSRGWLLILKVHPQMEGDFQLQLLKERYADCPNLLFWDNSCDFYEVIDQVDLAIVDYSSIFFDMVARGVKRFARYIFDYDNKEKLRDFAFDYLEVTCGNVCRTFSELLSEFDSDQPSDPEELARVFDWAWAYAKQGSIEDIVKKACAYEPDESEELPTLYSFDVFDTLIARSTGSPESVFEYVRDGMVQSGLAFPEHLIARYVSARTRAEAAARRFVERTEELRDDGRTEIAFDQIFDRLRETYDLSDQQAEWLRARELEGERMVSCPVPETIAEVRKLVQDGQKVVLISDMYLPEAFVRELLCKADPLLATLDLFLSSAIGRQKTKKGLYLDVFHALDYRFGQWIHTGDSLRADVEAAQELGIKTRQFKSKVRLGAYEAGLQKALGTFDGRLAAGFVSQQLEKSQSVYERFARAYASLYFVPYVSWVIDHALRQGLECLYFISRDGHHLKRIADAIIQERGLDLETRFIFGSRKAWRVPSQASGIDADFFSSFGNFTGVFDYESLVDAASIAEEDLFAAIPALQTLKGRTDISKDERVRIVEMLEGSDAYRSALLDAAKRQSQLVVEYLRANIDFSKRFAFVEFWGRGYTQSCHSRLLEAADERSRGSVYYYAQSVYPTQGDDVRFNFTDNMRSQRAIEYLFANMPYATVAGYEKTEDGVVPVLEWIDYNERVFAALEEYLPQAAADFARLEFVDAQGACQDIFDYALDYYSAHQSQEEFVRCVAPLKDSMAIRGQLVEYAPKLTFAQMIKLARGADSQTRSKRMSLARSNGLAAKAIGWYESRRPETR